MKKVISIAMVLVMCLSVAIITSSASAKVKNIEYTYPEKAFSLVARIVPHEQDKGDWFKAYQGFEYHIEFGIVSSSGKFYTLRGLDSKTRTFVANKDKGSTTKSYYVKIVNTKLLLHSNIPNNKKLKNRLQNYVDNCYNYWGKKNTLKFDGTFKCSPVQLRTSTVRLEKKLVGYHKYEYKYYVRMSIVSRANIPLKYYKVYEDTNHLTYNNNLKTISGMRDFEIYLKEKAKKYINKSFKVKLYFNNGSSACKTIKIKNIFNKSII